jgi:hypothetical protein
LGYLDHSAVLRESRAADYIVALYDPARIINRFAASNKIAEALGVARPVIVNEELAIAPYLRQQGCSLQIAYGDLPGLGDRLVGARNDLPAYRDLCRNARRAYERDYSWENSVVHVAVAAFPPLVRS